ncbi:MAG: glycoside hydrolase family 32 protein [Clostridia bacterium]|nr:glycoside hydrolase family 32 protein [Clostridia bacterium]
MKQAKISHTKIGDRRAARTVIGAFAAAMAIILFTGGYIMGTGSRKTFAAGEAGQTENQQGDALRPAYHFTANYGWINDPNGLVYNSETGEYNLFYQCNQTLKEDIGAKCWGHAVSRDLMHWTELEPAILPDENGAIWSGSAVIDRDNTSGLFDGSIPPGARMVVFFTYFGGDRSIGAEKQGLAYSVDNGRTWIKYGGNPIIAEPSVTDGFRDPKVFRFTDANGNAKWGLVVAGGKARLYTSDDLIHWLPAGFCRDINGNVITTECPDLFCIAADGGNGSCWVLSCAGRAYYTGTLTPGTDGSLGFRADSTQKTLADGSGDMYAFQTFSDVPDGRRLGFYWLIDTTMQGENASLLEGKNWDGVESLPLELKLVAGEGGTRLAAYPAEEVYDYAGKEPVWSCGEMTLGEEGIALYPEGDLSSALLRLRFRADEKARLSVELLKRGDESTGISYSSAGGSVTLVRSRNSGAVKKNNVSIKVLPAGDGTVCLDIFTDKSVVSVFDGQGGALEGLVFPAGTGKAGITICARGGSVELISAEIYEMTGNNGSGNSGDNEGPATPEGGTDGNGTSGNGRLSAGVTAAIIAAIALVGAASVGAILILGRKR